MNDERITTTTIEDDSDFWNHQLELEERRRRESETLDSRTQEVTENLSKAIAILSHVPKGEYPVIADLAKRLKIEREFLRTRQSLSLNNLVKTARRLLHEHESKALLSHQDWDRMQYYVDTFSGAGKDEQNN